MIMNTAHEEEVGGVVVGRYMLICTLRYEGRQQGATFFAESEDAAIHAAEASKEEIRKDCGSAFLDIYPRDAWEMRIHG